MKYREHDVGCLLPALPFLFFLFVLCFGGIKAAWGVINPDSASPSAGSPFILGVFIVSGLCFLCWVVQTFDQLNHNSNGAFNVLVAYVLISPLLLAVSSYRCLLRCGHYLLRSKQSITTKADFKYEFRDVVNVTGKSNVIDQVLASYKYKAGRWTKDEKFNAERGLCQSEHKAGSPVRISIFNSDGSLLAVYSRTNNSYVFDLVETKARWGLVADIKVTI